MTSSSSDPASRRTSPATSPPPGDPQAWPSGFRSPAQAAVVGLVRLADRARRELGEALAAESLTLQQFNVLRILRGAGPAGLPTLAVGERMVEQTPGVTRLLDRLQKQGWVTRERDEEDRRRVVARITEEGRRLLERVDAPFARAEEAIFRDLPDEVVGALAHRLHQALRAVEGEAAADETSGAGHRRTGRTHDGAGP